MTRQEVAALMGVLQVAYPSFYARQGRGEIISAVNLWAEMFSEYPAKIVTAAVKAYIADDNDFPPNPGKILTKVRRITRPAGMTEQEAWSVLKRAICNSGYHSREEFEKLPLEIRSIVHDPAQLKAWADDLEFNEAVVSSNFMRSYREFAANVREFQALPADVREIARQAGAGLAFDNGRGLLEVPR